MYIYEQRGNAGMIYQLKILINLLKQRERERERGTVERRE